jgi:hypothetical protein
MKQSKVKRMIAEQRQKTLERLPEYCEELIRAYKEMLGR